mmetsp:Transcript_22535/g.48550  ORF Transcript_22535/g.48550 Transcript_22535/m.48550 type:complete len:231 (+) Transcript_22535:83-775(+)
MTPVGVRTPGSARADRLRQPLESPLPGDTPARSASSTSLSSLSDRHLREIQTVFQIFDPDLSGRMDVPTFEVMARSLGFRMTRMEIAGMVEMLWEERRNDVVAARDEVVSADERRPIDLSTAIQILSQRGYAYRSEEDEMRMYFRIFDGGNKGYITLEDLKRVQDEARAAEREMDIGAAGSGMDVGAVGDATLEAMIEQFDRNRDGVIDYEEFKNVLEPVLTLSADSSSS